MSFSWAKRYEPKHPMMKWLDERLPIPRLVYGATGPGYPVPRNLNYFWNFGVLSGLALVMQILTGVILAMHYAANGGVAFGSVESIMVPARPLAAIDRNRMRTLKWSLRPEAIQAVLDALA